MTPLILAVLACGVAIAQPATIRDEFKKVDTILRPQFDEWVVPNTPETVPALNRMWSLVGEWVAGRLSARPASTTKEIESAILELDQRLGPDVIRLDPTTFVVSVALGEMGTFFVVSRDAALYHVAWSVVDVASRHPDRKPGLSSWAALPGEHPFKRLAGAPANLPSNSLGQPRFYVIAKYGQQMGGTHHFQLSVWQWNGHAAIPLLLGDYSVALGLTPPSTFDGVTLRIPTKSDLKRLFSCRGCIDPVGEWTIRVTPDGVIDLGRRLREPELLLVDELFDRIMKRQPATDIASADAIERLQAAFIETEGLLGMFGNVTVRRNGTTSRLCFDTDELGRLVFDLRQQNTGYYVTNARTANSSCAVAIDSAK